MLEASSVNPVGSTWKLRNRVFSLHLAERHGISIANFALLSDKFRNIQPGMSNLSGSGPSSSVAVKATGNCFVSTGEKDLTPELISFCQLAEDDGDTAYIFPASQLDASDLRQYIKEVGVAFAQEVIEVETEYRAYAVGTDFFLYERSEAAVFDRSSAPYQKTGEKLRGPLRESVLNLMQNEEIGYLCFDLVEKNSKKFIIDINPHGSFPPYQAFPGVVDTLSKYMINSSSIKK